MLKTYLRSNSVVLLLLILSLASGIPARAALNSVVSDCSNDTALRNAVSAGGTITFTCGVASIVLSGRMTISAETVIDGGGKITLNGNNNSAFFQVFVSQKLTLRNIVLDKGKFLGGHPVEVFGEAIFENVTLKRSEAGNTGGAVIVYDKFEARNSTFENNHAATSGVPSASGAAIRIDGGSALIEDSSFTDNSIGGTFGVGGAIAVNSGSLTVNNSTFSTNFAPDGGALYVGENTQVTVTHSIFKNNSARYGGAIESLGELQLDFSTLSTNKATIGDGGALWIVGSDADITYSTFSGNQSKTTGGAISCYNNSLSIIHSTISNNTVVDDNNAGTIEKGAGIFSTCNLNLTNSTLSGNKIPSGGGGGLYQEGTSSANLSYITVANNSALFGAGLYNDGGGSSTLTIEKSILANNSTGNCDGVVDSGGYNLASDNNCANFTQTGDQKNATLPLGLLANNGGPTATHLPLDGNPAINLIPAANCGFSSDQRDITRPQNTLCDSGAVEVEEVKKVFLPLVSK